MTSMNAVAASQWWSCSPPYSHFEMYLAGAFFLFVVACRELI